MNFLVATDGSDVSDTAIEYAVDAASAWDASLEIVHVLTPETELVNGSLLLPGEDEAMAQGEQTLEQATRRAHEAAAGSEIEITSELLAGRPAEAIADYAAEGGVDSIYIGHRGLSETQEQVVGSVAKTVVDKATVPVTIIK